MTNPSQRSLTEHQVERLTAKTDPWLSCDDCFDQVDYFIDALATDSPAELDEPLRVHLQNCPACLEEAESLLTLIVEEDSGEVESYVADFRAQLKPPVGQEPPSRPWSDRFRRRR